MAAATCTTVSAAALRLPGTQQQVGRRCRLLQGDAALVAMRQAGRASAVHRHSAARPTAPTERPTAAMSAAASSSTVSDGIPESREEAVQQAAAAIAAQLGGGKRLKQGRGFSSPGGRRLSVEVGEADTSSAATLQLAQDILAALPRKLAAQFTVVAADGAGARRAAGGSQPPAAVVSLQRCLEQRQVPSGCLLIAGAKQAQFAAMQQLLASWDGPAAVLLNPEWDPVEAPADQTDFVLSWDPAYCFQPLAMKFLVIRQEGAIFRFANTNASSSGGSGAAAPWRVFLREKSSWVPVGRMAHRPSSSDVESCFAAASAAKSPLTQGAKMLHGLFERRDKE